MQEKPWFMKRVIEFGFKDIVRLLFHRRITLIFKSPNGKCHAACSLETDINSLNDKVVRE